MQVDRSSVDNGSSGGSLRGPSFGRHAFGGATGSRDSCSSNSITVESESLGRQHGSFNALSFLQTGDFDRDASSSSPGGDTHNSMGIRTNVSLRVTPFEFTNGESDFTDPLPNEMSFLYGSFADGDGDAQSDGGGKGTEPRRGFALPQGHQNPNAASLPTQFQLPPRVVVVHGVGDADDDCAASAGRKQRGSFSSLLLLEAHELSTGGDGSPTHFRGGMQGHLEEEKGVGYRRPVSMLPVSA